MAGKRRDSWIIDQADYDTEEQFRAAVAEEMARFEHIGHRQGFGLVAAPIRQRVDGGIMTLGWQFRSERIPLVQADRTDPLPEAPEPEEDEELPQVDAVPVDHPDEDEPVREPASVATSDPYAEDS